MMEFEELCVAVARELEAARGARAEGNAGRVRVCARRAAGAAVRYWLRIHAGRSWEGDVVQMLRRLRDEPEAAMDVRQAAGRLVERITPAFLPRHPHDPLDDAELIIRSLAGKAFPAGFFRR